MRDQAISSPAAGEGERLPKVRHLPLILPADAQHRKLLPHRGQRGDAQVGRGAGIEAVVARRAERPEAGQRVSRPASPGGQAGAPVAAGMERPEHRLAEVAVLVGVGVEVGQELVAHRLLRPGERLLGAVVDARDAEGEQLERHAGDDLPFRGGVGREADLFAGDVIVIVEDRDVPGAGVAMRAEVVVPDPGEIKYAFGAGRPLATPWSARRMPPMSSVALRFWPMTRRYRSASSSEPATSPTRKKSALPRFPANSLMAPQKLRPTLVGDVLQRVEAEAVAVGERDPVLVAAREIVQRFGAVEVEVPEVEEVGAPERRVVVVEVCRRSPLRPPGCSSRRPAARSATRPQSTAVDGRDRRDCRRRRTRPPFDRTAGMAGTRAVAVHWRRASCCRSG